MGASISTNSAKVVVNAVSKIASEIVQNSNISHSSTQIISVTNVRGDVIILGNRMTQKVNINMSALLDALSTEQAQQNLAVELAQQAKSLTSGLNIGQLSVASNSMDTFIQASIDLISRIGQTCSTMSNQSQQILVENVIGSVRIENNVAEQVTDIIQNCVGNAVANNSAIQDVTARLSQSASATSAGISEWALVALAALVVGVPVVGGVVLLKYIFPVVLVAGILAIVVYFYYTTESMWLDAYSNFIADTSACVAEGAAPTTQFTTAERASVGCLADSNCVAFDWKGVDVHADGTFSVLDTPQTTFFSKIHQKCQSTVAKDNVKMVRAPVIFSGTGDLVSRPSNAVNGDVYVDCSTSQWFQWGLSGILEPKGIITHDRFSKLTVSGLVPNVSIPGVAENFYVYANPQNPQYWHVYRYEEDVPNRWVEQKKVPGPGMFASAPGITNASGFKTTGRKTWLLYSGIAAILVGAVGSGYVFLNKNTKDPAKDENK